MAGTARLDWNDKDVQRKLRNLLLKNSRAAGRLVAKETRQSISRRERSAPGDAPGRVTGKLRRSVKHRAVRSRSTGGITIRVGSGDFKSRFLELGTKYMAARPFLFPTFKKLARRMAGIVLKGNG